MSAVGSDAGKPLDEQGGQSDGDSKPSTERDEPQVSQPFRAAALITASVAMAFLGTGRDGSPPNWVHFCLTAGIGLGLGWACCTWLCRREAAISLSMMGWRFLLLLPLTFG